MVRVIGLAVISLVAAIGCVSNPSPTASPRASPAALQSVAQTAAAGEPLVTITARGGECPAGSCESATVIDGSGRVHSVAPAAAELGTARPDIMAALVQLIDAVDFSAIRAVPFSGECPTAFDGQELVYEFVTADGVERIASCETQVDPRHPLFATVAAVLANLPAP